MVVASLVGGRLSDRTGRRKVFVLVAATVYGLALMAIAVATDFDGFLVGMALAGLGFGVYVAVDLALVADVLPSTASTAKDLGVFNMAGALPFSVAPALAPFDPEPRRRQLRRAVRRRRGLRAPGSAGDPARQARAMSRLSASSRSSVGPPPVGWQ